jgi:hypothetical protein
MPEVLSQQDMNDLDQIAKMMPAGDPRIGKIHALMSSSQGAMFEQAKDKPGFWSNFGKDVGGLIGGGLPTDPVSFATTALQRGASAAANDFSRKQEGRSSTYRVAAPIAETLTGLNARGMEESANQGDVAGVFGHAAAPVAVAALSEGLARAGPKVAPFAMERASQAATAVRNVTPKQAGEVFGAASGAAAGHGIYSIPAGAASAHYIGKIIETMLGKERANAPIFAKSPSPVFPGAPLPSVPAPELLNPALASEARTLPGQISPERIFGPTPSPAMPIAPRQGLMLPGEVLSTKAAVSKIANGVEQSLGGKGLAPDVPIGKQQVITPVPQEAPKLPQGFTASDKSSALSGYKYDPATKEFEAISKGGYRYVYGDVSPEQFAKFEAAESKGTAWNEVRQSSPLTAKYVNDKRISVKPGNRQGNP